MRHIHSFPYDVHHSRRWSECRAEEEKIDSIRTRLDILDCWMWIKFGTQERLGERERVRNIMTNYLTCQFGFGGEEVCDRSAGCTSTGHSTTFNWSQIVNILRITNNFNFINDVSDTHRERATNPTTHTHTTTEERFRFILFMLVGRCCVILMMQRRLWSSRYRQTMEYTTIVTTNWSVVEIGTRNTLCSPR